MRRGVYILPSLFTVGTLICGYCAILAALRGTLAMAMGGTEGPTLAAFDEAAKLIGWAILFDGLDGRIARLTKSTSAFGREFDSLADVIAFGVAPAILAYAWGMRTVSELLTAPLGEHLHQAGWIVTFAYLICGAARLGRFNIESVKPASDRRFFVGLPIPAAAGCIAAIVHWQKTPLLQAGSSVGWMVVVAALAFLMVSRMRYYSFKMVDLSRRRSYLTVILLGLIIWGIWLDSERVLLALAGAYALSGIVLRIVSKFRSHPPATPEEVHAA
jgi:CDP-diacylglycerol--serine O-phosphatidyltransferase